MSETIVPQKTYLVVFLSLIGLTLLTTGVAFIDLGPFNTVVALVIAFCQNVARHFLFYGSAAEWRPGADRFDCRIFLACPAHGSDDDRLPNARLDARAGRLVNCRAADTPIIGNDPSEWRGLQPALLRVC